jgi:hypothetical protein
MRIGTTKAVLSSTALALTAAPFAVNGLHASHRHHKPRTPHSLRHQENDDRNEGGTGSGSTTTTMPGTTTTMPSTTTTTGPTTTTAPPAATMRVAAAFGAVTIGSPIVFNATVANDATSPQSVTLTISLSAPGGALPGFSYPMTVPAFLACTPSEIQSPGASAVFKCTGSVPASTSGVVVISSGSNIVGTSGQAVNATVTAQPAGVTATATATYA